MKQFTFYPILFRICCIFFLFFSTSGFAQTPSITSFTPTTGGVGTVITITGTNFTNVNFVTDVNFFDQIFVIDSDTQITATIGGNASTGVIRVKTPSSSFIPSSQVFTFIPLPNVTAMSPVLQAAGGSVILTGTNLTNASAVSFDGNPATSFVVNSDSQISAIVAANTLGETTITTPGGTASFIFPTISSFAPTSQLAGGQVIITGTKFTSATAVTFGGVQASNFIVNSDTQITATVANGASGSVAVRLSGTNSASLSGFTFLAPPSVASFSPTSAAQSGSIIINGTGFTGTTSVTFGGVAASGFTVNNPTQITAIVGNGASGSVSVTTSSGTGAKSGFTFIPQPVITSFTPDVANNGTVISIIGANFFSGGSSIVSGVKIIGIPVTSFNVVSNSEMEAIFDATGLTNGQFGAVEVTTLGGVATSASPLTFDNTLSLDGAENSFEQMKLFPNPAHDIVQLILPSGFDGSEDVILDVFSIDGRKLNLEFDELGRMRVVHVGLLPAGIYFISVKTIGNSKTFKFIKE